MKQLKIEVVEIKKRCGAGLKMGDHFFVLGKGRIKIPNEKPFCMFALNGLIPFLTARQRAVEGVDDWVADTDLLECPDTDGVVFRVTELP